MQSRLAACRRPVTSGGIVDSVCDTLERACLTSSSVPRPLRNRVSANSNDRFLDEDVFPGVGQTLFIGSHLDVIRGHFREQHDQRVAITFDRRVQVGFRAFDRASIATPEIDFPGKVQSVAPDVERAAGERQTQILAHLSMRVVDHGGLRLREEIADRDISLRTTLQNPRARGS